jgi:hypothetical protein
MTATLAGSTKVRAIRGLRALGGLPIANNASTKKASVVARHVSTGSPSHPGGLRGKVVVHLLNMTRSKRIPPKRPHLWPVEAHSVSAHDPNQPDDCSMLYGHNGQPVPQAGSVERVE